MNNIFRRSSEIAGDLVDSLTWVLKRFEAPGRNTDPAKAIGRTAEVSITVRPGRVGAVLIELGGTLQQYSARAKHEEMLLAKGAKVRITETGQHLFYVEPIEDVEPA